MKKITSTSAKNKFGEIITTSQREPVIIEKNGSEVAVVISYEAYQEYRKSKAADRYWGELADDAIKMIGNQESERFFKNFGK